MSPWQLQIVNCSYRANYKANILTFRFDSWRAGLRNGVGIGDWINTRCRLGPLYGITAQRSGYRVCVCFSMFVFLATGSKFSSIFHQHHFWLPFKVLTVFFPLFFVIFHNECIMHYFFLYHFFPLLLFVMLLEPNRVGFEIIELFAWLCLRRSPANKLSLMMDNSQRTDHGHGTGKCVL